MCGGGTAGPSCGGAYSCDGAQRRQGTKVQGLALERIPALWVTLPPPPKKKPSRDELALASEMRLTTREAEVLYFLGRVRPMMHEHCEESFVDLGQSINRCRLFLSDTVPCITPSSRLWKRRAREWLLAPEATLAQGYDPAYVPCLTNFSHRQILNLMGNAFNSSSYLVALATALGAGVVDTRRMRSSGDAIPQSPSKHLVSALEDGRDDDLEGTWCGC